MTNIQKLYEIANITCKDLEFCKNCIYMKNNQCIDKQELIENCLPFTAKKQLELINWFIKTFAEIETLEINYYLNDSFQISSCNSVSKFEFEFEEALASFILNIWQALTDDQKEEIKRILSEVENENN